MSRLSDFTAVQAGLRNRVINGGMQIDQRNAGASVAITTTAALVYLVDRFGYYVTQASKLTAQQNAGAVTPPVGFSNYLGFTSTSAYSVVAADLFLLEHKIEANNTADLAWGTVNAKAVTLSFQVYSSLTGTFGGAINSAGGTYTYPFSYNIPVANTWTTVSIQIPGPTSGTWGTGVNGSIQINFGLGVGSTGSGTAGSWVASSVFSVTGAVSVVGTNAATWYVTGVQLEAGSVATTFEQRPYGMELALCQRYYEKSFDIGTAPANGSNLTSFSTNVGTTIIIDPYRTTLLANSYPGRNTLKFKVSKRVAPACSVYGNSSGCPYKYGGSGNGWLTANFGLSSTTEGMEFTNEYDGTTTLYNSYVELHWAANSEL